MKIHHAFLAATALSAALISHAPSQAAEAKFYTDSTLKSGDQYSVPKLWASKAEGDHVVLTPPEKDAKVILVPVDGASDVTDAIQKAWKAYSPKGEAAKIDEPPTSGVAKDGWDERQGGGFTAGKKSIRAAAMRKGTHWLVMFTDAPKGADERHSGTIGIVDKSLLPAGYKPESFVGRTPHHMDAERIQKLKSFLSDAMQKLGVPGVGLAVIDDGKVVVEEGLGVRELGKPDPVTKDSLFMIGSNTKGMTTLMIAKMIDEGKLSWDKPVTELYPDFNPGRDAALTRKVMLRHLACACTGEPRQDMEWLLNTNHDSPATKTFDLLKLSKPTTPFGEEFQYSNLMVSAAGFVAGHVLYPEMEIGAAYDRAIQEKVFGPLGMTSVTFDFRKALTLNHTSPHGLGFDGKPAVSKRDFDYPAIRPAGTLWSTAGDVLKYVQNEITQGKSPDEKQLYSAKNVLERRTHSVATSKDTYYGIGLESTKMGGLDVITHGGGTSGHISNWWAIPSAKIGMVVLTNSTQGGLLIGPAIQKLLELVYDAQPLAEAEVASGVANSAAAHAKEVKDIQVPVPADIASGLAARYVSPVLGAIDVRKENGEVYFATSSYSSRMGAKKDKDSVTLQGIEPGADDLELTLGKRGGKTTLTLHDGQHEYVYEAAN